MNQPVFYFIISKSFDYLIYNITKTKILIKLTTSPCIKGAFMIQ
nr:MAG TPA: hypothetical protein [Caudoviricetes sp.]